MSSSNMSSLNIYLARTFGFTLQDYASRINIHGPLVIYHPLQKCVPLLQVFSGREILYRNLVLTIINSNIHRLLAIVISEASNNLPRTCDDDACSSGELF
jgi:hypothetical protein